MLFSTRRHAQAFTAILIVAVAMSAEEAQAQGRPGWCTDYVATAYGLRGYPDAYKWANGYLASKGFRQSAVPVPGAIVVFQPGVHGVDGVKGHVAIVQSASGFCTLNRRLGFAMRIRGARQGGTQFSDLGFTNVSVIPSTFMVGEPGISFWVR